MTLNPETLQDDACEDARQSWTVGDVFKFEGITYTVTKVWEDGTVYASTGRRSQKHSASFTPEELERVQLGRCLR